ncbi:MAG: hypothetical protein IT453_10695 [Planctomycetes bacterium]|nr:hypothetical protein [Planctomycetota bacterium]
MRAATDEFAIAKALWNERFPNASSLDVDAVANLSVLNERHAAARDEAIRRLEEQLDALVK